MAAKSVLDTEPRFVLFQSEWQSWDLSTGCVVTIFTGEGEMNCRVFSRDDIIATTTGLVRTKLTNVNNNINLPKSRENFPGPYSVGLSAFCPISNASRAPRGV
jgi:hypothetical protein